jgi:hypothetical protein
MCSICLGKNTKVFTHTTHRKFVTPPIVQQLVIYTHCILLRRRVPSAMPIYILDLTTFDFLDLT